MTNETHTIFWNRRRIIRLVWWALVITVVVVAWTVVPVWLRALVTSSMARQTKLGFLWAMLIGYGVITLVAGVGTLALGIVLVRARRRGQFRPMVARGLLLCVTLLLGLGMLEASSALWQRWAHRMPELPTEFASEGADDELYLVVIGGSSARGEPYQDFLSVGEILGWQLERVFAPRTVQVEVLAEPGAHLEHMHHKLANLERRPDALIVYSGHNEFQARFAWKRVVPHYVDEIPRRPQLAAIDWAGRTSTFCGLVLETLEKHRLDLPPPPVVTRELIDYPTCNPLEYQHLLNDFERRLEAIVSYCQHIGAVPILISPCGNDAGFDPDRSVLLPETSAEQRDAFAREFEAARALEESDPTAAASRYRAILDRQPTFAEVHFRLGRLLEQSGAYELAYRHYVQARDFDGLPLRCPSDFQQVYPRVASRHPEALFIDAQALFRDLSPHGILGDDLIHDGQHPNLKGHVALAQAVLNQMAERGVLGWPEGVAAPTIDLAECEAHFGLTPEVWALICQRVAHFYRTIAFVRYDPSERLARADVYEDAANRIADGEPPASLGIPGVGVDSERVE